MDKRRIGKAGMGSSRSGLFRIGTGPSDPKKRMRTYVILLLVIGGLWIGLSIGGGDDETSPRVGEGTPDDAPVQREPLADVDPALLAEVEDNDPVDRVVLEDEPTEHLVEQASLLVPGDLEQLGLRRLSWRTLTEEPQAHRGTPTWVLGTIAWMRREPDLLLPRTHAEIVDEQGRSWYVIVVTETATVGEGDVVRVEGFFLKHHEWSRPGLSRERVHGPVLVGEEMIPSTFRMDPVTELTPYVLASVRDYDVQEASRPLESPQLYEFLSYVENTPYEELFPDDDGTEQRAGELMNEPRAWRGEPVRLSGSLLAKVHRFLGPRGQNPLGHEKIWLLYLHNTGGITLALSLDEPPDVEIGDIVDVDGVFFRRYVFENRRNAFVPSAAVVAKRLEHYVPPPDTLQPALAALVGALVTLAVVLLVWAQRRANAEAARSRERWVARKRRQVAAARAGPPAPAEAPAPEGDR